jgi:type IV pilus assembly protein PilP
MRIDPLQRFVTAACASVRRSRPFLFAVMAVGLVGCASDEFSDLQSYVQEVKSRPPGRIAPIPEFETYETFTYRDRELRDPFVPKEEATLQAGAPNGEGLRPDTNRHKEALENFPLDGLKFVGILENNAETWAIIKAPDDLVYRVRAGNYMGQNFGEVASVDESKVELMEIVPDGLGGWMKRPAALAIEE